MHNQRKEMLDGETPPDLAALNAGKIQMPKGAEALRLGPPLENRPGGGLPGDWCYFKSPTAELGVWQGENVIQGLDDKYYGFISDDDPGWRTRGEWETKLKAKLLGDVKPLDFQRLLMLPQK
jgi:hypothetical protein